MSLQGEKGIVMDAQELERCLAQGEGQTVEFKRCGGKPGNDVFETICSFANRQGGNIFLGVNDTGTVEGVPAAAELGIRRNIVNVINDKNLFNAAPLVGLETIEYEGKTVIRVWVPMGAQVYTFKGTAYDRLADADVRVVGVDGMSALYLRKQGAYSERRIFPYVEMADLRGDLIERARILASNRMPGHPWEDMSDEELLRSARLYGSDRMTGEEGFNLAAVLLLGKDGVIGDVCPSYRTDAILRLHNLDRYDDREIVMTNIIDSYDKLIHFCQKHLPDRFLLEGTTRVSARDMILRELVANTLIHREYLSPFPARIVIDAKGIRTENASRALFEGRLSLDDFSPMPKNPIIADFFRQIGRAEELGSGFRNLHRYSLAYSGRDVVLEEGDVFKAIVPTAIVAQAQGDDAVDAAMRVLLARDGYVTSQDLARETGVSARTAQRHIKRRLDAGELVQTTVRGARAYAATRTD